MTVKDNKAKETLSGVTDTVVDFVSKDGNKDVGAAIKQGIDATVKNEDAKKALKGATDAVADLTSKKGKNDAGTAQSSTAAAASGSTVQQSK